ncbi:MAG: hypothetical protein E7H32_08220 [Anaerococcus sp.]|nr:hypothetical protein [Anaerococcus sp.]MDU4026646.1 hypothetical protein [Anaerococcus sp.]
MDEQELKQGITKAVEDVRKTKPMAPSITNAVTVILWQMHNLQ